MGKALITANKGNGLYEIELMQDIAGITRKVISIDAQITILNIQIIPDLIVQKNAAQNEMDAALALLNSIIEEYKLGQKTREEVIVANADYNHKISIYQQLSQLLDLENLELISLYSQKSYLLANANPIFMVASCIDGATNLSGEVGTIEIPGEIGIVKIQPGYENNATYNPARDGILQKTMAGSPASIFYNRALLPGWQKFMPTYRLGIITELTGAYSFVFMLDHPPRVEITWYYGFSYKFCTVKFDDIKSSAQRLNINRLSTIANVPIDNHLKNLPLPDAGTRVVIKFENQRWDKPKIIGFESPSKKIDFKFQLRWGNREIYTPNDPIIYGKIDFWLSHYEAGAPNYDIDYSFNPITKYWEIIVNEPYSPPYYLNIVVNDFFYEGIYSTFPPGFYLINIDPSGRHY